MWNYVLKETKSLICLIWRNEFAYESIIISLQKSDHKKKIKDFSLFSVVYPFRCDTFCLIILFLEIICGEYFFEREFRLMIQ